MQFIEVDGPETSVAAFPTHQRVGAQERHPLVFKDPVVGTLIIALHPRRQTLQMRRHPRGEDAGWFDQLIVDRNDSEATFSWLKLPAEHQLSLRTGIPQDFLK